MSLLNMLKTRIAIAAAPGTYAAMWPTATSKNDLLKYFDKVPDLVDDFHVTTTYSRNPVPLRNRSLDIVLDHRHFAYDMFGENKNVLVMKVNHPNLDRLWQKAMSLGATWDHEQYMPHITLSSNFGGDLSVLPPTPTFDITLDRYIVDVLKED